MAPLGPAMDKYIKDYGRQKFDLIIKDIQRSNIHTVTGWKTNMRILFGEWGFDPREI